MDYIIIVAGGKGLRMGSDVPKQFLPVKGMPVLMRTISRFHECKPSMQIILVLPHTSSNTGTTCATNTPSASPTRW